MRRIFEACVAAITIDDDDDIPEHHSQLEVDEKAARNALIERYKTSIPKLNEQLELIKTHSVMSKRATSTPAKASIYEAKRRGIIALEESLAFQTTQQQCATANHCLTLQKAEQAARNEITNHAFSFFNRKKLEFKQSTDQMEAEKDGWCVVPTPTEKSTDEFPPPPVNPVNSSVC